MFIRKEPARLSEEVIQGYTQKSWTIARTARECGLSVSATWFALRRQGVMTRPVFRLRLKDEDVERARRGEVTGVELARKYQVSAECVNRHLRKLGLDSGLRVRLSFRRSRLVNGARGRAPRDKVFRLRAKGLSLRQIGSRLGVSHERVRQILAEEA